MILQVSSNLRDSVISVTWGFAYPVMYASQLINFAHSEQTPSHSTCLGDENGHTDK